MNNQKKVREQIMIKYITAESVTIGHPDKLCDYIADSVLDATLTLDPNARVACEVMASKGEIAVAGEITAVHYPGYDDVISNALIEAGYKPSEFTMHFNIHQQSLDIKNGVDNSYETREKFHSPDDYERLGAGDQGIVMGYACNETPELMPKPIMLAHWAAMELESLRKSGQIPYLKPDGKTQATVKYVDGNPVAVETFVISTQHSDGVPQSMIHKDISTKMKMLTSQPPKNLLINPSGRFVEGGPAADTGLTGRKLMVDTYGGGHHGGGAFSGKDPTKVDRSGAYMARYIAKTIVAAKYATKCEVQIAYAIGKASPVGFYVDTFGTGAISDESLTRAAKTAFDMRPAAIIDLFKLRRPIYKKTAVYGHFGHYEYPWEQVENAVPVFLNAVDKLLL